MKNERKNLENRSSIYARNMQYEFVRVIAMFEVIAVHVVGNLPADTYMREGLYDILTLLFYTCNGLFFFISGKFALESCTSISEYYKKRCLKIIIPMLFYMLIRQIYLSQNLVLDANFWKTYFSNVLSGFSGTEYWFLYILIGNLLLAPILRKAFVEASNKELYFFVFLGLGYNAMITYLPYWGISFAWTYLFGGWTFYFYLGFCVERIINSSLQIKSQG